MLLKFDASFKGPIVVLITKNIENPTPSTPSKPY
jgi:hypothetical protein